MTSEKDVLDKWVKFVEEMFKGLELSVLPRGDTGPEYGSLEGIILGDELEDAVRCMSVHISQGYRQ